MVIHRFYKSPGLLSGQLSNKFNLVSQQSDLITGVETEVCYYVESKKSLTKEEINIIEWTLSSPLESQGLTDSSVLVQAGENSGGSYLIIEIGPR